MGLISLVSDNHMGNNLKEILVFVYYDLIANNQPLNKVFSTTVLWVSQPFSLVENL